MNLLYLYALAAQPPGGLPGEGLAGEPIEVVPLGGSILALAGVVPARPRLSRDSLAAHDAVVRRLAALLPALLPARFGETAPDVEALRQRLAPRAADLSAALALVEGSVQMTLRVFTEGDAAPGKGPAVEAAHAEGRGSVGPSAARGSNEGAHTKEQAEAGRSHDPAEVTGSKVMDPQVIGPEATGREAAGLEAALGPGARYLAERRRLQQQRRSLPEVAALREALRPLLRAERVERHQAGRLLATAYDLVERGQVDAYRSTVERESARLAGYRVAASGPWLPYAFAPEVVP